MILPLVWAWWGQYGDADYITDADKQTVIDWSSLLGQEIACDIPPAWHFN